MSQFPDLTAADIPVSLQPEKKEKKRRGRQKGVFRAPLDLKIFTIKAMPSLVHRNLKSKAAILGMTMEELAVAMIAKGLREAERELGIADDDEVVKDQQA